MWWYVEWPELLVFIPFSMSFISIFWQSVVVGRVNPYVHITETAAVLTAISLAWLALSIHRAVNTYINKATR